MAEKELDVIVKAQAQNAAAIDEVHGKVVQMGAAVDEARAKTTAANVALTEHSKAGKQAAEAEKDVTKEGREAAKAMGEMGARGGELFERFSSLAGVMGSGGPFGLAIGGALLAVGALAEGAHKLDETYQEQQTSARNLKQATDATGVSYEEVNKQFEEFINNNAQYVRNEEEAKGALASFVRAGDDAATSIDDLNLALDLSVGYHISLEDAARRVILAEQGQGRALKEVGIDLASLKNADDNATTAHKVYEEATKKVEEAQSKLATATQRLRIEEDALAGKHKLTASEADRLAQAHKEVDDATQKLGDATANQKSAQDKLNTSVTTANQVHGELHSKVDNLRKAESDQEQQTNQLGKDWATFTSQTGPGVVHVFEFMTDAADGFVQLLSDIVTLSEAAASALGDMNSRAMAATTAGTAANAPHGVRAAGGPVYPGGTYTVGEAGPETLVMGGGGGGYVIPNSGSGAGGGGVNVYVTTAADPYEIGREVAWAMKYG